MFSDSGDEDYNSEEGMTMDSKRKGCKCESIFFNIHAGGCPPPPNNAFPPTIFNFRLWSKWLKIPLKD